MRVEALGASRRILASAEPFVRDSRRTLAEARWASAIPARTFPDSRSSRTDSPRLLKQRGAESVSVPTDAADAQWEPATNTTESRGADENS